MSKVDGGVSEYGLAPNLSAVAKNLDRGRKSVQEIDRSMSSLGIKHGSVSNMLVSPSGQPRLKRKSICG